MTAPPRPIRRYFRRWPGGSGAAGRPFRAHPSWGAHVFRSRLNLQAVSCVLLISMLDLSDALVSFSVGFGSSFFFRMLIVFDCSDISYICSCDICVMLLQDVRHWKTCNRPIHALRTSGLFCSSPAAHARGGHVRWLNRSLKLSQFIHLTDISELFYIFFGKLFFLVKIFMQIYVWKKSTFSRKLASLTLAGTGGGGSDAATNVFSQIYQERAVWFIWNLA